MNHNDLIKLGTDLADAKEACSKAFRKVYNDAPLMEADDFWKFMELVSKEIRGFRFGYGRTNGVKQGAEEVGRQIWCNQLPKGYDFTAQQFVSFAKTYSELDTQLSKALWDVVTDYGDDSYGDLIDTLPLLGRDFCKMILDGKWEKGDHKEFIAALKKEAKQWEYERNPRLPAIQRFFVNGEEFVHMALSEAAEQCLFRWYADQTVQEPKEPSLV
jgi:hypothetical protein